MTTYHMSWMFVVSASLATHLQCYACKGTRIARQMCRPGQAGFYVPRLSAVPIAAPSSQTPGAKIVASLDHSLHYKRLYQSAKTLTAERRKEGGSTVAEDSSAPLRVKTEI
ncbi:hypothetical protein C8R47DRAFT_1141281 [Mycena vitilis]|nr:hypothetical protein C8R47DRAFT_1141281 [Mycena vitilis]